MTKSRKKKSLIAYTFKDWKPSDLLAIEKDINKESDVFIEDRIFFSKRRALRWFGSYDNEIKKVRITIQEL